ncbi:AN1-type zinc finger protein 2B [Vanrija pseudolonga]|uniref:AN1-type zinc finger protein 2B n=1 Tax=Vanrija pseudolonga TaxID=143232 RepID=A0AAF0YCM3_9TREE|nr:AN1-type zinc finger protein 2B [Vanrija pseudolonga]
MSSSSTPTPPDGYKPELMSLGTECHHDACHLHDFLPFSCPACMLAFCQDHFLPSHHTCTAPLPASMVDRIAPTCPLCNEVVSSTGHRGPNHAVEAHIMSGTCTGMEGGEARKKALLKARKDRGEVCFRRGCTKVLVVPMACGTCTHKFCPSHRSAQSHSCTPTPVGSPAPAQQQGAGKSAMSRLLQSSSSSSSSKPAAKPIAAPKPQQPPSQPVSAQLEARAAAAQAALKRAGQDAKVPFVKTKTEKRADAELQSTIKSLKARHDKGLLTKAEQVR